MCVRKLVIRKAKLLSKIVAKYQTSVSCLWSLLICAMLLSACSNTKYLASNQVLLVSNKVNLKGSLSTREREDLKNNLTSPSILQQKPNRKFLNFRIPLYLYNQKYKEKKTSWFWKWLLTEKNIEAPVIYDSTKTQQSADNMRNYLDNQGYFYASVDYDQKIKRRKASITYNVNTGKNFIIDSIAYDIPDTAIRSIVMASSKESLLKPGTAFKVETVSEEQDRIALAIKNAGYYRFSNNDIKFVVDTIHSSLFQNLFNPFENIENIYDISRSQHTPTLHLTIQISSPPDSTSYQPYTLRHIYIYPDYSFSGKPDDSTLHEEKLRNNITVRYHDRIIKNRPLLRALYFRQGDLYSQNNYNYTIGKLNEMGVWRFVTVEMDTIPGNPGLLDSYIFLIPGKKQEIGADLEATNSSDYIIGGALNLSYQNKNLNRAANLLTANLKAGVEWNSDKNQSFFIQAREFSGQVNLSYPHFLTPWKMRHVGMFSNARTNVGVGFDYLDRLRFFTLSSFNGSFGYNWNETDRKKWIINPFSFAYNRLFHVSDSFQTQLDENPFLKNSLESTFIGGMGGSFIFNTQSSAQQQSFNYVRVNVEESGLMLEGIDAALSGLSGGRTDFAHLTSIGFSQYVKADAEYKHYFNFGHSTLVGHAYGGIGIPYGGSNVLPYIKQFTAGGPNSMRAWRLRTLGPGSYLDPNINNSNVFIDQTGEMKLEGNIEYRFDIFKMFGGFMMLKGAAFVDAGNIWNLHKNPYKPGAEFQLNRFYQDIAVGSGLGLRLDFSYAVLRLDFATPLKVPFQPEHYGWIANTIRPFDKQWRRDNLIFNFAVGYPF